MEHFCVVDFVQQMSHKFLVFVDLGHGNELWQLHDAVESRFKVTNKLL